MKNILTIIFLLFTFLSYSQTKDYKPAYELTKQLNTQYKIKITSLDSVVSTQDLYIEDLQSIILVNKKLTANDSLHISLLVNQKDFLNKNLNLYKKELNQQDRFWNTPTFGIIVGVVSTVGLIHVIGYTLP